MATETSQPVKAANPADFQKSLMSDDAFVKGFQEAYAKDKPDETTTTTTTTSAQPTTQPAPKPPAQPAQPVQQPVSQTVPETPAADDTPPPSIKGTKAAEDWKRLKAEHRKQTSALEDKSRALEAKIADLEKRPASIINEDELKALRSERDQYSDAIKLIEVERHPKFKAYFKSAMDAQITKAKGIVGPALSADIENILVLPESPYRASRLKDVLMQLEPFEQNRLAVVVDKLSDIQIERQGEIAKQQENYAKVQAQNEEATKAKRSKVDEIFKNTVAKLQDKSNGYALLQTRDGDDAWNKSVEQRLGYAAKVFRGEIPIEEWARVAAMAPTVPDVIGAMLKLTNERDALQKELDGLRSVSPNATGGKEPTGLPDKEDEGAGGFDAMLARAKQIEFGR